MVGRSKILVGCGMLACLGWAGYNSWVGKPYNLQEGFSYLSYPILKLNSQIVEYLSFGRGWFSNSSSQTDAELLDQVVALQAENIVLLAKAKYWQENQALINFAERYNCQKSLLAQIFFKNFQPSALFFLLDRGSRDGVELGMVAVWHSFLIGKVVAVYPQYCQVALLTNIACRVAVYGEGGNLAGICCGKNNPEELDLNYVSHLQKIMPNERLISSGEGETFPQGFGVGTVTKFQVENVYYKATAKPLVDFKAIKYCYLIASNQAVLEL